MLHLSVLSHSSLLLPLLLLLSSMLLFSSSLKLPPSPAHLSTSSTRLFSTPWSSSPLLSLPPHAHLLLSSLLPTLLPTDAVIDATAGNGSDSHFLASSLSSLPSPPLLVCIDVQEEAVKKTSKRLATVAFQNVEVHHRSHYPLDPPPGRTLALALYNLGYLPNSSPSPSSPRVATDTDLSIPSMIEALAAIRVGGLVLATSYPNSNLPEHLAVLDLSATLGSLSNKSPRPHSPTTAAVRRHVQAVDKEKGFRVFETRGVGRVDSPVMTTFTRIK